MENQALRESLICQADEAFYMIADQCNNLFDAAKYYADGHVLKTQSRSLSIKLKYLNGSVKDLGTLVKGLATEVERWKREEDRVLSRIGIELQFLVEIKANIEASMLFLIREDIPLGDFSLGTVNRAHADLMRCNNLL